jgi:hypothetical protein
MFYRLGTVQPQLGFHLAILAGSQPPGVENPASTIALRQRGTGLVGRARIGRRRLVAPRNISNG